MRIRKNLCFRKRNKMTLNKKAQEEIVGFVLIVIIVTIAGIILLGIFLRQPENNSLESKDIYHFLESAMEITSSCAPSYEPAYSKLSELFKDCFEGLSTCTSGESPCSVLNKTLTQTIDSSFFTDKRAEIKGYQFQSLYTTNSTQKEILSIYNGNCANAIQGSEILLPAFPGTIANTLKLCY